MHRPHPAFFHLTDGRRISSTTLRVRCASRWNRFWPTRAFTSRTAAVAVNLDAVRLLSESEFCMMSGAKVPVPKGRAAAQPLAAAQKSFKAPFLPTGIPTKPAFHGKEEMRCQRHWFSPEAAQREASGRRMARRARLDWRPDIITGTSVGCLNSVMFALDAYETARDMWTRIGDENVLKLPAAAIFLIFPPSCRISLRAAGWMSAARADGGACARRGRAARRAIRFGLVTVEQRGLRARG